PVLYGNVGLVEQDVKRDAIVAIGIMNLRVRRGSKGVDHIIQRRGAGRQALHRVSFNKQILMMWIRVQLEIDLPVMVRIDSGRLPDIRKPVTVAVRSLGNIEENLPASIVPALTVALGRVVGE